MAENVYAWEKQAARAGPLSKMLTSEKELCIKAFLFLSLKMKRDCPALAKLSRGLFCVHFLFFSQLSTAKQTIKKALSLSWNVGERLQFPFSRHANGPWVRRWRLLPNKWLSLTLLFHGKVDVSAA